MTPFYLTGEFCCEASTEPNVGYTCASKDTLLDAYKGKQIHV